MASEQRSRIELARHGRQLQSAELEENAERDNQRIALLEEHKKLLEKEVALQQEEIAVHEREEALRRTLIDEHMAFVRSNIEWKRRCDFLGVELTNRTEDLVHAKRHIAEQEQELQGLELQVLHCMNNAAGPAKKRRRKEKKVEFDPAVVAAAVELAHERRRLRQRPPPIDAPSLVPVPVPSAPARSAACQSHGAESELKGVVLRIWPLNPTANGRNFDADLAKMVPAAETAKQGFSAVTRKNRLSKGTN